MNWILRIGLFLLAVCQVSSAIDTETFTRNDRALVVSSNPQSVVIAFDLQDYEDEVTDVQGSDCHQFTMRDEGITFSENRPCLPMVSRFIVVPPTAGLELVVVYDEPESTPLNMPLLTLSGEDETFTPCDVRNVDLEEPEGSLYPPCIAEISDPVVIRGVRVVKVTTYPLQCDFSTGQLLHYPHITTEIRFTDDPPINPACKPVRKNRSRQFLNYIRNLALNGDEVGRDDPDEYYEYVGHYLVIGHENCLQYISPFVEWRRRSGWKVDIISLNRYDAADDDEVKDRISALYESYLNDDIDPFDHILLVGDRGHYLEPPRPNWILEAPLGESIWNHGARHADYLYACLEGNDRYPDAAINRWGSGYQDMMELAVDRTLMYEATPDMDDESWFTSGCSYSQHWGNNEGAGWHASLVTCARWGVEVLERCGFDDIVYYENHDWDQWGEELYPVLRDVFNDGANVMLGRAQNYQWRYDFNGVADNTVFPINIFISGHGEGPADMMFRIGSRNHLKGTVASVFGWGAPTTVPMSAVWLEIVNGFMLKDMTLGWARNWAITTLESYIPDYGWRGSTIYRHIKSDIDAYGDPAIQPWIGVPKMVEATFPESIHPLTKHIEVTVVDLDAEISAQGAFVTLYAPGDIPDDLEDYVGYDDMIVQTRLTDNRGIARFDFPRDNEFEAGTTMYVTVTGRNVCPFLGEVDIEVPTIAVEIDEYQLEEDEGNGDGNVNPGETFELTITAQNAGDIEVVHGIQAIVRSESRWVSVSEDTIRFGEIEPEEAVRGDRSIEIQIASSCPDGSCCPEKKPILEIVFFNQEYSWISSIILEPLAPCFSIIRINNGNVVYDQSRSLNLTIENVGYQDAARLDAHLFSVSNSIIIESSETTYPALEVSQSAYQDGERLRIRKNPAAIPGTSCEMMLILQEVNDGLIDTIRFNLQAAVAGEGDPLGPDDYGYVCYDDGDFDWEDAPDYDWIEISLAVQDRDFDGTRMDFDGNSPCSMGEAMVIPLGFDFGFYGDSYDSITVATNGFISVGSQPLAVNFQNWPLDHAIGGGVGMIAPFWQDLELENDSDVHYYYDEDNHCFIVEWRNLDHRNDNRSRVTFEVVLYDPEFDDSPTGDGNILFQYQTIQNERNARQRESDWEENIPYASVGISSPDGTCGISYSFAGDYPDNAAGLRNRRAIVFKVHHQEWNGTLYGMVIDSDIEQPLEGVSVQTSYGLNASSDEEGFWIIEDATANMEFSITASLQGYNSSTMSELFLAPDEELEVNFTLNHPEISASIDSLDIELDSDQQSAMDLVLQNDGNGQLDWRGEALQNDEDANSWWCRRSIYAERETNDDYINGVVFTGDNFVASGSNGDQPNMIYILNAGGELANQFEQPGDSETGMLDLAWDGELVWGSGESEVYGFDLDGEVITHFEGPHVNNRLIAWDPDRWCFWIAGSQTDIIAVNRQGIQRQIVNSQGMRMLGLAYRTEPEDDYPLYVLHTTGLGQYVVTRMNPDNGDTLFVCNLESEEGGQPVSASITDQLFNGCWTFMTCSDDVFNHNGDRVDCWRMNLVGDSKWIKIDPAEGVIQPEDSMEVNLSLDARNLQDGLHEGRIRLQHNAVGQTLDIGVSLQVTQVMPPLPFDLCEPEDLDTLNTTQITFMWTESIDPDPDDIVSYLLHITHNATERSISVIDTLSAVNIDSLGFDLNLNLPFHWWVDAVSDLDTVQSSQQFSFMINPTGAGSSEHETPFTFDLQSIHPNPFNNSAIIRFSVDRFKDVRLVIYDVSGREIIELIDRSMKPGVYNVEWQANDLPTGFYLVGLESEGSRKFGKAVIVK